MNNFTKIGSCPHCGAPIWARAKREDSTAPDTSPPQAEYSCSCRLSAIPTYVPPVVPQPWRYYEGPFRNPWDFIYITAPNTTGAYVTNGTDPNPVTFDATIFAMN
jgi:hypothetical protein